jgi:hypothetical protein
VVLQAFPVCEGRHLLNLFHGPGLYADTGYPVALPRLEIFLETVQGRVVTNQVPDVYGDIGLGGGTGGKKERGRQTEKDSVFHSFYF